MNVAVVAGFLYPAEARLKAQFFRAMAARRLLLAPQGSAWLGHPDLMKLTRQVRAALGAGHALKLIHARPNSAEYATRLHQFLDEVSREYPEAHFLVEADLRAIEKEPLVEHVWKWLGGEFANALPTIDSITAGFHGATPMICIRQAKETSFSRTFSHLGIPATDFEKVAIEVSVARLPLAVAKIQELTSRDGPLLWAKNGFRGELPGIILEEFEGRILHGLSPLDAILAMLTHIGRVEIDQELIHAATAQRSLLPPSPLVRPGFKITAGFLPCKSVGGDFYDWIESPDGTHVIVFADVVGKGIGAALMAARIQGIIRSAAAAGLGPAEIAQRVHNELLGMDNKNTELFCGVVSADVRDITYFFAGHVQPILRRANGSFEHLPNTGTMPGYPALGKHIPTFEERTLSCEPGDRLGRVKSRV